MTHTWRLTEREFMGHLTQSAYKAQKCNRETRGVAT
jgi:hypothetical protein